MPADASQLARILVEANRATFDGLVPERCLDSPTLEESARNWQRTLSEGNFKDGQFLLVVEDSSGYLFGYALAGTETGYSDYECELNVLMVDTDWQRRGIGRKLLSSVAERLISRGINSLLVGVQIDNPNRTFYEILGGRLAGERPLDWDGYATKVVLYGWSDIRTLLESESIDPATTTKISAAYDRWSESYDTQENPTRDLDRFVLRKLFPEVAGPTVVECGCGTGKNTVWLAPRCERLIALDFSEGMLRVAKSKVNAEHVEFHLHDIYQPWSFIANKVDTVLFNLVLEHIDDLNKVFANAARVMRAGSKLLLSEYHAARLQAGDGARFVPDGEVQEVYVGSYTHTYDEYHRATKETGLRLINSAEWDDHDLGIEPSTSEQQIPRILSMIFEKSG